MLLTGGVTIDDDRDVVEECFCGKRSGGGGSCKVSGVVLSDSLVLKARGVEIVSSSAGEELGSRFREDEPSFVEEASVLS